MIEKMAFSMETYRMNRSLPIYDKHTSEGGIYPVLHILCLYYLNRTLSTSLLRQEANVLKPRIFTDAQMHSESEPASEGE